MFDAHCHLHMAAAADVPTMRALVSAAQSAGVVGSAVCSTSPADWEEVAAARQACPEFVWPQYGIHPWWVTDDLAAQEETWGSELRSRLRRDPAAGVGETGLDKTRRAAASLDVQRKVCLAHLRIARDERRPVTLHCVRAYGSLAELLEGFSRDECATTAPMPTCVLHSFRGPIDFIPRFAALGCYFSYCGQPLDAAHLSLVRATPRARLLLETDSPDQMPGDAVLGFKKPHEEEGSETSAGPVAPSVPQPARGESHSGSGLSLARNEPAHLPAICTYIAAQLKLDAEQLACETTQNAYRVYSRIITTRLRDDSGLRL